MRILMHSRVFLPSYGGLEKMMHMVATELMRAGHEVTVMTATEGACDTPAKYRVLRHPSPLEIVKEAAAANICLEANISLRTTPLFLSLCRHVVVTHQGWYGPAHSRDPRNLLKRLLATRTHNIFCSAGTRRMIPAAGIVIPNAFGTAFMQTHRDVVRDRGIVFLGRLVSDKGCDVLLDAIAILRSRGCVARLRIIGGGPEERALKERSRQLELSDQVSFAGKLEGEALARELSQHQVMAVPSKWEEPFGIVALEGIASGCVVVGTDGGGLPEAIGPCGIIVKRGDARAFADGLQRALEDRQLAEECRTAAASHLALHTQEAIGARYAAALERVARGGSLVSEQSAAGPA